MSAVEWQGGGVISVDALLQSSILSSSYFLCRLSSVFSSFLTPPKNMPVCGLA